MRQAVLSELDPRLGKAAAAAALGLWVLGRGFRPIHRTS